MHNNNLSIILPCYNPVDGWEENVLTNIQLLRSRIPVAELILVNDGSTNDLTEEVSYIQQHIKDVTFHYINYTDNKGKGNAIRLGLQKTSNPLIIYTDIDFPYTLDSVTNIYSLLTVRENKIVVGIKDETYYKSVPFLRKWISISLRKMIALTFSIKTADTQCGLKGMRESAKDVWLQGKVDRYLFDLEAIHNASRQNLSIITFPVTLREGVTFSKIPFFRLMKEVRNFLALVIKK